jgi:glutamate synthase (NADPH/NADH) large chain
MLQAAVQQGDYTKFKEYTSLVDNRPVSMIRDLFKVKDPRHAAGHQ